MSAADGGRGTPPIPPEGHGPPQEIPILKEITYRSQGTNAQRADKGAVISVVVVDGGQPVQLHIVVGESGKKTILEELAGGITLP